MTSIELAGIVALLFVLYFGFRIRRWWIWRPVEVVARDDLVLRCDRLGLSGKPDRLLRLRNDAIVPVEKKGGHSTGTRASALMQLGAYLLLVESTFGRRPPFGILVLSDDRTERIENTWWLRLRTLYILSRIRRQRSQMDRPARATAYPKKCRRCSVLSSCQRGMQTRKAKE